MLTSTNEVSILCLLQLADSAVPVGGAAHSFGLETLTDEGALAPANLETFLHGYIEEGGGLDALFVRRAWNRSGLRTLSQEYGARRPARESRDASLKLGRRFVELVNALIETPGLERDLHYCIAFGAAGGILNIPKHATVLAYLHQSITALISACQRLMPLGQATAAKILWNLKPAIARAAHNEEVWCFSPYPELASIRHGSLETRLFIS